MPDTTAETYLPARGGLVALRRAVDDCRGCDLYRGTTQAVLGTGPAGARLLMAGEQRDDVYR